jgi:hypothetical protein
MVDVVLAIYSTDQVAESIPIPALFVPSSIAVKLTDRTAALVSMTPLKPL